MKPVPGCPKCAQLADPFGTMYSYELGDGRRWHFDVDAGIKIAAAAIAAGRPLWEVDAEGIKGHLSDNEIMECHVAHVPTTRPALAGWYTIDGCEAILLIDGNHRITRLIREGAKTVLVAWLEEEEMRSILLWGPEQPPRGKIAAAATLITLLGGFPCPLNQKPNP